MRIVTDFDGTVTAIDTINHLCDRYTPRACGRDKLADLVSGRRTLQDILSEEIVALRGAVDDLPTAAVNDVPIRAGFAEFAARVAELEDVDLVVVSSGFRELIEPMLAAAGVSGLRVIANSVDLTVGDADGGVYWDEGDACPHCGQACKRRHVEALRAEAPDHELVFIGDGFSDRCATGAADRILATRQLHEWLNEHGREHAYFEDFHDVARILID